MDFAARVAADPTGRPDPAPLRAHGLSDVEVLHIVLAACARRFFSGVLSAVDAVPDAAYDEVLDPELRSAITGTTCCRINDDLSRHCHRPSTTTNVTGR